MFEFKHTTKTGDTVTMVTGETDFHELMEKFEQFLGGCGISFAGGPDSGAVLDLLIDDEPQDNEQLHDDDMGA